MRFLMLAVLCFLAGVVAGQATTTPGSTNSTTMTFGAVNCTWTQRNTVNPATSLPYCVRIGLIDPRLFGYYSHQLPQELLLRHVLPDVSAEANHSVILSVENTTLEWVPGISAVAAGELDVFVANLWILRDGLDMVDYTVPMYSESLGLVYLKPVQDPPGLFLLFQPFSASVWVAVLFTFLVAFAALAVTEFAHPGSTAGDPAHLADRSAVAESLHRALFHTMYIPFGSHEHHAYSVPGKMVTWAASFFFMIVLATYTAALASLLTSNAADRTETAASLLRKPVMVTPGDTAAFIESFGGQPVVKDWSLVTPEGLKSLSSEVNSYSNTELTVKAHARTHCDVAWIRMDFAIDSGWAIRPRNAGLTEFKRRVDERLLRVKEAGLLDRLVQAGMPADACDTEAPVASGGSAPVAFQSMAGLFLITGVAFAFVLLGSAISAVVNQRSSTSSSSVDDGNSNTQLP